MCVLSATYDRLSGLKPFHSVKACNFFMNFWTHTILSSIQLIKKSITVFRNANGCAWVYFLFIRIERIVCVCGGGARPDNTNIQVRKMCYSCVLSLCLSKVSPAIYSKMKKTGSLNSAVYFPPLLYSFVAFWYAVHVRSVTGISNPPPLLLCGDFFNWTRRALRIFICAFLTTWNKKYSVIIVWCLVFPFQLREKSVTNFRKNMHAIYFFVSVSYLEGNEQKIREIDWIRGR